MPKKDENKLSEQELIRAAMSALGKKTSEAKKKSSASNGKLGGRPKKAK